MPDEKRVQMPGGDYSLIQGFADMRSKLAEANVDVLVIFDTHWFTTTEHIVAGAASFKGEYTSEELAGLDPTWEEEFIFCVDDVENDKISAVFYICDQKLGDEQHFALNKLLRKKQTFKGLVVPGGKADFMFTALNFGEEQAAEEDDAFMDFL